jgi:hypothetical protein
MRACRTTSARRSFKDKLEMRNFARFLKLYPVYKLRMLDSPRWQRYLNLTDAEAFRAGTWERLAQGAPFARIRPADSIVSSSPLNEVPDA